MTKSSPSYQLTQGDSILQREQNTYENVVIVRKKNNEILLVVFADFRKGLSVESLPYPRDGMTDPTRGEWPNGLYSLQDRNQMF